MLVLANWLTDLMTVFFVLTAFVMILVILIQKPKGGGLSGAFGGGGGSQQAVFGSKVGDVLTYFTIGCFVAFLLLAIALVFSTRAEQKRSDSEIIQSQPASAPVAPPEAPGTPEAPTTTPTPETPKAPATETPAAPTPAPAPAPVPPVEDGQ